MENRACDSCRVRRTKCDRASPCERCRVSDLECTYLVQPKRRGPAGRTVERLRTTLSNATSDLEPSINPRASKQLDQLSTSLLLDDLRLNSPEKPLGVVSAYGHRGTSYMLELDGRLDYLFESYASVLHHLSPVVDLDVVRKRLDEKDHFRDESFAALVLSCVAMPLLVPNSLCYDPAKADDVIQESIRLHHSLDLGLAPTLDTLSTSMNIAAYARNRKGEAAAFLRTKESHGIVELLRLNTIDGYSGLQPTERELALRMFWLLAAAERSNCLIYNHQVNLKGNFDWLAVALPSLSDLACRLRSGSRLYEAVDADIIRCMTGVCGVTQTVANQRCSLTAESVMQHHYALDAADFRTETLSPVQLADLHLTRNWLHVKLWQVSATHGLLAVWDIGKPEQYGELSLFYPLVRAAAVVDLLDILPSDAVRGNGKTMFTKLNNIIDMADVVLGLPSALTTTSVEALSTLYAEKTLRLKALVAAFEDNAWLRWES